MKRVRYGLAVAAALVAFATPGTAQEEIEIVGNVAVLSDYVFRGISQTDEQAAIQGGLDIGLPSGFYLGTWGSNVGFARSVELDVYGGIAPSVSGFDLNLGVTYYGYPGADDEGAELDFIELIAGAARSFGLFSAEVTGAYSPEYTGESGSAMYGQVGASVAIPSSPVSLSGSLGYQSIDDNDAFTLPDYMNWSAGASVGVLGASLGVSVIGTDVDNDEFNCDICDTRVVFSLSR
jgi:uncharacterized protein (TIGR02001 family)